MPGLTTTVVTRTLTGIAADSRLAGGPGEWSLPRVAAVASVLLGALAGALLVHAGHGPWILLAGPLLLAVVAAAAAYHWRSTAAWTRPRS